MLEILLGIGIALAAGCVFLVWLLAKPVLRPRRRRLYRVVWEGGMWAWIWATDADQAATFGRERYADAGRIRKVVAR